MRDWRWFPALLHAYVLLCAGVSLIAGSVSRQYDLYLLGLYLLCGGIGFWRKDIYAYLLSLTLVLALFNRLHAFAGYETTVWVEFSSGAFRTPVIDPRILLLLVPFLILAYRVLKTALMAFLNDPPEDGRATGNPQQ